MNDTEDTMHDDSRNGNRGLMAHEVALEGAALALQLTDMISKPFRSLANQVVRSAASVPANLAEGAGRAGRDRTYHWHVAYASALEVGSHLELLKRVGAVDAWQAQKTLDTFDRVRALTWRLIQSTR